MEGKEKGKKQRTWSQKSSSACRVTFGLSVIREKLAAKTKDQSALKVEAVSTKTQCGETIEAQSAVKMEAETTVSLLPYSVTLESEAAVSTETQCEETDEAQSALKMEAETAVSLLPSSVPLEAEAAVSTTVSTETQSADTSVGSEVDLRTGMDMDMNEQTLLQIHELELNLLMGEKEEKMDLLEKETFSLVKKAEQLRNPLTEANEEKAGFIVERSKGAKMEWDAAMKIRKLEAAIKAETEKRKEVETCLARQVEETSKVKIALAQAENDLEKSRCQWDEERSCLVAEQKLATSSLKASLIQAREDLYKQRLQWHMEMSCLLESPRKVKRKSKWQRFLQLFRRTGRTQRQSDLSE